MLCNREGGIVTLTLNRGDKFNPLSEEMLAALQAEIDAIAKGIAVVTGSQRMIHDEFDALFTPSEALISRNINRLTVRHLRIIAVTR